MKFICSSVIGKRTIVTIRHNYFIFSKLKSYINDPTQNYVYHALSQTGVWYEYPSMTEVLNSKDFGKAIRLASFLDACLRRVEFQKLEK